MKTRQYFISRANDITVNVDGEQVVIISKAEVIEFVNQVYDKKFVNRSQAKKLTKLSYLGGVNVSSKVEKGLKKDIHTFILYLAPYIGLFGNVCAMGEHCADPCLNTSGRVKMDKREFKILRARNFKTMLWYINREYFCQWLFAEIAAHSKRLGDKFVVRLNGTSDLSPKLFKAFGVNILDAFPSVQFYDYTKIPNRINMHNPNGNYHVTFSYNGYNQDDCDRARAKGINVSIVVDGEKPKTWRGVNVFSMDETDLRPFDQAIGQYGYLKLKETLNKAYDTKFIIGQDELDHDQLITSLSDAVLEPSKNALAQQFAKMQTFVSIT
jgi:hypothetical protein